MAEVWIMETGEDHGGGRIVGVYADKNLAFGEFAAQAAQLDARFSGIDAAEQREGGWRYLHSGCDWLTLVSYPVITAPQLPLGAA